MPKKSNLVLQYHVYQFGQYKGTLFGTKRDRSPEKIKEYFIHKGDDDYEEEQKQKILEEAKHGDKVRYIASNVLNDKETRVFLDKKNNQLKLGKWKELF